MGTWKRLRNVRRAMVGWMAFWVIISMMFAFWTYSIQDSLARIADYFDLKAKEKWGRRSDE